MGERVYTTRPETIGSHLETTGQPAPYGRLITHCWAGGCRKCERGNLGQALNFQVAFTRIQTPAGQSLPTMIAAWLLGLAALAHGYVHSWSWGSKVELCFQAEVQSRKLFWIILIQNIVYYLPYKQNSFRSTFTKQLLREVKAMITEYNIWIYILLNHSVVLIHLALG